MRVSNLIQKKQLDSGTTTQYLEKQVHLAIITDIFSYCNNILKVRVENWSRREEKGLQEIINANNIRKIAQHGGELTENSTTVNGKDECSFQDIILLPSSPKFTQENIYWNFSEVQKKKQG